MPSFISGLYPPLDPSPAADCRNTIRYNPGKKLPFKLTREIKVPPGMPKPSTTRLLLSKSIINNIPHIEDLVFGTMIP